MRERGVLVSTYYYLMVAHEAPHLARLLEAMESSLTYIEQVIGDGRLSEVAGVPRGTRGFARLA